MHTALFRNMPCSPRQTDNPIVRRSVDTEQMPENKWVIQAQKPGHPDTILGDNPEVVAPPRGVPGPADGQFQLLCRSFDSLPRGPRFTRENKDAIKRH